MRLIERLECALNPYLLAQYLIRPPFGSSAWIISINNMEDLIGGHYWVSFYLIIGGYWHIQTRALTMTTRAFTWSAEAYLSYTLSAVTLCGSITSLFSWYNNTAYPSEFYGPAGAEFFSSTKLYIPHTRLEIRYQNIFIRKVQQLACQRRALLANFRL